MRSPPAKKPAPPKRPLTASTGSPADWNDYFSKRQPKPAVVRDLVMKLHEAGEHEHVIAAIEAALINGQSQPWMYEVLALSMEIAGRPKADIERVLLSTVDFTAVDFVNMMYSAAYLARFKRNAQALRLYRQASRVQKTRPEPYVLGLKLAEGLKDYDAVQWAATGILTYAWTGNRERLHRDAENAVLEVDQRLRKAGRNKRADDLHQAMAEARKRDLVVKLTWSGVGDLDLIVEEPLGTVCSINSRQSPGGGVLVHDGYGPNQKNCYDEYVCVFGGAGVYRVRIHHVWGNIVGKRAQLTVVRYQGTANESTRTVSIELAEKDQTVRVPLTAGRRTELAAVPKPVKPRMVRQKSRPSLMQMMGGGNPGSNAAAQGFQNSRNVLAQRNPNGVGFQPVISVLSEGVTMSALALVSGDRRYVRITTAPAFTSITDVFTFSFINSGNPNGGGQGGNAGGGRGN